NTDYYMEPAPPTPTPTDTATITPTNTPTPTPTPTFTPTPIPNLIQNGNFNSGLAAWTSSGDVDANLDIERDGNGNASRLVFLHAAGRGNCYANRNCHRNPLPVFLCV